MTDVTMTIVRARVSDTEIRPIIMFGVSECPNFLANISNLMHKAMQLSLCTSDRLFPSRWHGIRSLLVQRPNLLQLAVTLFVLPVQSRARTRVIGKPQRGVALIFRDISVGASC